MNRVTGTWALLATTLVTGCSLLQPPPERGSVVEPPPWPSEPAAPVTSHQFERDDLNRSVFGQTQVLRARDSDTFSDIARSYGLGYDELKAANEGVDPWLPGQDTEIVLPTRFVLPDAPAQGIVLNIAAKRLYFFNEDSQSGAKTVTTYPIGIGRVGWATPTGSATVIAKATDPAWYVPASVRAEHRAAGDPLPAVVPPGPDNPLGRHVLKLDMPGYLLHGTNQPYGVGMRVSHGCVRLYPEDIETLYDATPRGTDVTIVNQPLVAGWEGGALWLASYPILEDDQRDLEVLFEESLAYLADRHGIVLESAGRAALREMLERGDGIPRRWDSTEWIADNPTPVQNVATMGDDAPTRAEVSEMIEALMQEPETTADAENL